MSEDHEFPAREGKPLGNERLDAHHAMERHLADRLERSIIEKSGITVLSELFEELCDYVVLHFTTEEKIMVEAEYPETSSHQAHHDRMRENLFELEKRFRSGDTSAAPDTLALLRQWAFHHIPTADRAFAQYLLERR